MLRMQRGEFQFHTGSIKSELPSFEATKPVHQFQFHTGSIKSLLFQASDRVAC